MVRFTVDVRAAMAVGEDPVVNKQKQILQLLKASKIHLLDTVGKMGENILLIPCPSPPPTCSLQHDPSFLQVTEGSRNSRQQPFFYDSLVSYVARNVCEGAWREDTTN